MSHNAFFTMGLHQKCQKATGLLKNKKGVHVHTKTTASNGIFTIYGIKVPHIMRQSPTAERYLINPVLRKLLNTLCKSQPKARGVYVSKNVICFTVQQSDWEAIYFIL